MSEYGLEKSEIPTLILLLHGLWDVDNPRALQDIIWRKFRKKLLIRNDGRDLSNSEAGEFITASFPHVFVQLDGFRFDIFALAEPLFGDREAVAEQMKELRLRQAVLDHQAYVCVHLRSYPAEIDADEAARMVGRMTAALGWSPATLAVATPRLEHLRLWDKNIRKALRREHPLTALIDTPSCKVPVVPGDAENVELREASEEARRRWHEFTRAYARRSPEQLFAVKAPFTDGEFIEHMWIKVVKIEGEFLQGVLDNDPMSLKKYKRGMRVRLRVKALSDWMYSEGEELIGGFTNKALDNSQETRLARLRTTYTWDGEAFADDEEEEAVHSPQPSAPLAPSKEATRQQSALRALQGMVGGRAAAVGLLCGGLAFGLTVWLNHRGETPLASTAHQSQPPSAVKRLRPHGGVSRQHILTEFAESLSQKDLDAAYACTSPAFQQRQSVEQFKNVVYASEVLEGTLPFHFETVDRNRPEKTNFNLHYEGTNLGDPPAVVLRIIHDVEGWWVDQIEWKSSAAQR